ncbi:MAG: chorismate mutase, partial [Rikenellaceae bacterium]
NDVPMICDPSHIAGRREPLFDLSQQAADLNFDGLIIESHCSPCDAWSDASQQLTPEDLSVMLDRLVWRSEDVDRSELNNALAILRGQIDQFDGQIFELLSHRMDVVQKIGEVKRDNNVMILQTKRWDDVVGRLLDRSDDLGLTKEFMSILLSAIHMESIGRQNSVMNKDL